MTKRELSRRDFERLALAAIGGLAAGCQEPAKPPAVAKSDEIHPLLDEPHVCRGLNACKGFGSESCAGLGQCATEAAKHHCLPLDDRAAERFDSELAGRPDLVGGRTSMMLYAGMKHLSEDTVLNMKGKSYVITAEIVVPVDCAN